MNATVLVVDDKELMRDSVGSTLRRAGFEVRVAGDGPGAVRSIAERRPDAVVTDLKMPGMTGLELLAKIREVDEELPVVLMTAFGTIETAVDAMRHGAFDYITKPFEGDELVITVKRALQHGRLLRENAILKRAGNEQGNAASGDEPGTGLARLIGLSPAMRQVREQIAAVAASSGTVLVTGESGVGKEVVARAVHEMSPRAGGPLLAVNCAALSEGVLESELFGHERGAFTGAERLRKGRFELADGGTLVLDEVSEVSPRVQAKLLRVLQERAFERVGSSVTIGVDVRVVATSNRDLPASVAKGDFREDLYYRLNVLPVLVPPLRERLDDVPGLIQHFAARIAAREGREAVRFEDAALDLLCGYGWPGNVRELGNICERAVVLCGPGGVVRRETIEPWLACASHRAGPSRIEPSQSGPSQSDPGPAEPARGEPVVHARNGSAFGKAQPLRPRADEAEASVTGRTLAEIERETIVQTLRRYNGHRAKTASALGIGVRTLGLKLKKWKELELVEATL